MSITFLALKIFQGKYEAEKNIFTVSRNGEDKLN